MRELDFTPDWYPKVRRRKQALIVQSWATLAVLAVASLWVLHQHRQARASEVQLVEISVAMDRTRADLKKLDDLLVLEDKWKQRDQVLIKLGLHVEATRLLEKLDEIMPREMGVLDLDLATEETRPQAGALSRATEAATKDVPPDRRLRARLRGVAPTDVDLANFLAHLSGVPYFESVAMTYAKDRAESGHVMREYEVTFSLNLNAPAVH